MKTLTRAVATAFALTLATMPAAMGQDAPAAEQAAPELVPDIVLGNADAPLTIIEYASFTCSHCAAFHDENFPKLKSEYIDTGKVKFIQRDIYFDALGLWAGVLARCGGDDKYYGVADMLFDEQKEWLAGKSGEDIAENLRKIGAKSGMDQEQMDACWADEGMVERLVATFQKNAGDDAIDSTPTFIIGGEKVPNQAWDTMKAKIDEKLAEAEG